MVEEHVEQKVEILDKATTERLVLINTPENSTKLRFDIRQLQEFFAAECLYDSVKAEDLRSRITIIGGDAHWREVIHFLLSSLVENDRSTELSVAIEELCKLNEGDTDGADRILNRRAGRGALIAARLLSEGVLEQDKAVRQRFRECLTPMAAFANYGRLGSFISVRQENSSAWLMTFLLDKLRESAYAENVGAAIVLSHSLPDSHPRVGEIVRFLQKAPSNYIAAITETFMGRSRESERSEVPDWFSSLLISLLMKPNWADLGADGIHQAARLLHRKTSQKDTPLAALPPQYKSLLWFLNFAWQGNTTGISVASGNLRIIAQGLEPGIVEANAQLHPAALDGEAPGVFRSVQLMLQYTKKPSRSAYAAMLRAVVPAEDGTLRPLRHALRIPWPVLKPGVKLGVFAENVEKLNDSEFADLLRSDQLRCESRISTIMEIGFEGRGTVTAADIVACYDHSPAVALELVVFLSIGVHHRTITESPHTLRDAVQKLIPRIHADSTVLLAVPWSWHFLLANAGAAAEDTRSLLFAAGRNSLPYGRRERHSPLFHRFGNLDVLVDTYRVAVVNKQPSLLPHFTDLLLSQVRIFGDFSRYLPGSRSALPSDLLTELLGSQQYLNELRGDANQCWSVRCSAALLLMFHADETSTPIADVGQLFVQRCNSKSGEWLLDGLVTVLSIVGREQTPALTTLLRDLFEACREDYCARASLEQILMVWREASAAPVTKHGVRDKWLYRSEP
jgi:hypothetical protein